MSFCSHWLQGERGAEWQSFHCRPSSAALRELSAVVIFVSRPKPGLLSMLLVPSTSAKTYVL